MIYLAIVIVDSFSIPPLSILRPESFLNTSMLFVFNTCVFAIFILYPIIRGIIWCFKKGQSTKTTIHSQSEIDKSEKSVSVKIISIFLSGASIVLGTYPIILMLFLSIEDILDYLSELDFIIMFVYVIVLPLSGLILSTVSVIWKKWWLSQMTLLYCCVEFINAVFFIAFNLIPPIERLIG